jgi:PAS domain S-box-containing protein
MKKDEEKTKEQLIKELEKLRKQVRAHNNNEELLSIVYNNSDISIFVINVTESGKYNYEGINPIHEKLLGLTNAELIGKSPDDLVGSLGEEAVEYIKRFYDECVQKNEIIESEFYVPQGVAKGWWLSRIAPQFDDESGRVIRLIGSSMVITDRKKAEEQIQKNLKEKEVLVREINHRVKNNLQMLVSLLNMQQRATENEEVINALAEYKDRIYTMALLHNHLTKSENLSEINMEEFLKQLVKVTTPTITTEFKIDEIDFPVNIATSCGLIVNELMTNAMKHAFKGSQKNQIRVSMKVLKSGVVTLGVRDNGVGLPEGFDIEKDSRTGLNLVRILSKIQLQGSCEINSDKKGTNFMVKFKKDSI